MKYNTLIVGGSGALGRCVLENFNKVSRTFNVDVIKTNLATKEFILQQNSYP